MESYLSEADEMATCAGCRCGVTTVYLVSRKDDTDLSQPGDALRDACFYALLCAVRRVLLCHALQE
eukprot:15435381-Alexandrium_andersonii.AAC.1